MYYNKLLPTGNSSPAPRFYGLPKIHKANCPMCPIVSACGMATYQLAKFLTKILQRYTGIIPSFVKDSKSFSDHLKSVNISREEELVSFDISALFTSIPVPHSLRHHQQAVSVNILRTLRPSISIVAPLDATPLVFKRMR